MTGSRRTSFALSPVKKVEETEVDLDVLLRKYATQISALQQHETLKPLLDPVEHDDVFLLRHILSTKGVLERAASSAEQCIVWRRENAELLRQAEELHHRVKEVLPVGMLPHASTLDQPIQVVMPFQVQLERWATSPLDWHFQTGIANREIAYRLCDRITRQRRKLIKLILLQDLSGLTFGFIRSQYRLGSVQGRLSKISSFVYPQMLATVVIVNAPSFMSTLFRLGSNFVSQKVLDKMKVCRDADEVCAAANLEYERLPSFLGGGYDWEASWIPEKLRVLGREGAAERGRTKAKHSFRAESEPGVRSAAGTGASEPSGQDRQRGDAAPAAQPQGGAAVPSLVAPTPAPTAVSVPAVQASSTKRPRERQSSRSVLVMLALGVAMALGGRVFCSSPLGAPLCTQLDAWHSAWTTPPCAARSVCTAAASAGKQLSRGGGERATVVRRRGT